MTIKIKWKSKKEFLEKKDLELELLFNTFKEELLSDNEKSLIICSEDTTALVTKYENVANMIEIIWTLITKSIMSLLENKIMPLIKSKWLEYDELDIYQLLITKITTWYIVYLNKDSKELKESLPLFNKIIKTYEKSLEELSDYYNK